MDIVINTNPQENIKNNIGYGLQFANEFKFEPQIIHVIDRRELGWFPPNTGPIEYHANLTYEELVEKEKRIIKRKIQDIINHELSKTDKPFHVKYKIEMGLIEEVLLNETQNLKAEMILLSNYEHDHHLLAGYFEHLIEKIQCPVLIIPEKYMYKPIQKILFPSEYSAYDYKIIKEIQQLTQNKSVQTTILHIKTKNNEQEKPGKENLIKHLSDESDDVYTDTVEINGNDIRNTIHYFIEKKGFDMIVLIKKTKSFIEDLFSAHTFNKIIRESKIPILVFYESEMS